MMNIGAQVVRVKNHKKTKYSPGGISKEFGEVVEVTPDRVRVKWSGRQWNDQPVKPIGRNLRTWNKPNTLQVIS